MQPGYTGQCPYYNKERVIMFNELEKIGELWKDRLNDMSQAILYILLGRQSEGFTFEEMLQV